MICVVLLMISGTEDTLCGAMGSSDGIHLRISSEQNGHTGEVILSMNLSSSFYEISEGGAVALYLALVLWEGWYLAEARLCEGGEGMHLTVGEDGNEVRILMDGVPSEDEDSLQILELFLKKEPGSKQPFGMEISREKEAGLYYMGENGKICICVVSIQEDWNGETLNTQEDDTTHTEMPIATEEESEKEQEPVDAEDWTYVGCQETCVKEGEYAVRFLFVGRTGEPPVVCVRGGGFLRMESGEVSELSEAGRVCKGSWSVCTFRGLREEREYVFLVYAEQGIIRVTYAKGQFKGHLPL